MTAPIAGQQLLGLARVRKVARVAGLPLALTLTL
jgi:hypothetical protein